MLLHPLFNPNWMFAEPFEQCAAEMPHPIRQNAEQCWNYSNNKYLYFEAIGRWYGILGL
jgi:hypothetical protein